MADKTITKSSTMTSDYYKQTQIDQTLRLREVLKTLPPIREGLFPGYGAQIVCKDENQLCI